MRIYDGRASCFIARTFRWLQKISRARSMMVNNFSGCKFIIKQKNLSNSFCEIFFALRNLTYSSRAWLIWGFRRCWRELDARLPTRLASLSRCFGKASSVLMISQWNPQTDHDNANNTTRGSELARSEIVRRHTVVWARLAIPKKTSWKYYVQSPHKFTTFNHSIWTRNRTRRGRKKKSLAWLQKQCPCRLANGLRMEDLRFGCA